MIRRSVAVLGLVLAACAASPSTSVGSPPSPQVTVATSTPSAHSDLAALHAEVSEQQARLKAQGINIVTWGPDAGAGRERLTVQDLTPEKVATLQRYFGADDIVLTSTPDAAAGCGCPATPVSPGSTWPGSVTPTKAPGS